MIGHGWATLIARSSLLAAYLRLVFTNRQSVMRISRNLPRPLSLTPTPDRHAVLASLTAFFRSAFGSETSSNTLII